MNPIPFNQPYKCGSELAYIENVINSRNWSGNGYYTGLCHEYFEKFLGNGKSLLTTSCTDALEMIGLLLDLGPSDEIIIPSFSFVSSANAFALRNVKIEMADSLSDFPNIDPKSIESLVTNNTRAIVVIHYAGSACDMDEIQKIANRHNLLVVEDAAQAIQSFYHDQPVGTLGDFAAFSFHETKNISCGEGGLLHINNSQYHSRAEVLWEKGTNRKAFSQGLVDKYTWIDLGSSYLPSELNAAVLFSQIEAIDLITSKRKRIWNQYLDGLQKLANEGRITYPFYPQNSTNNYHMFFFMCKNQRERQELIDYLSNNGIMAVFHYQPLHLSPFYLKDRSRQKLSNAEMFGDTLIRLPLYCDLAEEQVTRVIRFIHNFYQKN